MTFVPIYILILFLTIIVDYIAGIMIEQAAGEKRRWFLILSIISNVGVLAFFKYYNFFVVNTNFLFHIFSPAIALPLLKIILPIGLSFHTFQAMSYTIEVYRGNQKAERHFGIYSLYVMFYPQLVAGPIERPQNLLHQFHEKHYFDYDDVVGGLRLMLWGMIKKVVIADRLALVVDSIYNNPQNNSGVGMAIGTMLFAFQIFCDFSGYSDIAIGAARVMGFKLMTNFNNPYHSKNVSEFWGRWHISLSTWFRDYLYIPLGGNRVPVPRMYFNLFFVFLVSGFWHGANWTFIMWGALHGFYLVFGVITSSFRKKISKLSGLSNVKILHSSINVITTFLLVSFAWIFFRANNIKDAFYIIKKIFRINLELVHVWQTKKIAFLMLPNLKNALLPCLALVACLELAHIAAYKFRLKETFKTKPFVVRWGLYFAGLAALFFLGVYSDRQFIYFQF